MHKLMQEINTAVKNYIPFLLSPSPNLLFKTPFNKHIYVFTFMSRREQRIQWCTCDSLKSRDFVCRTLVQGSNHVSCILGIRSRNEELNKFRHSLHFFSFVVI